MPDHREGPQQAGDIANLTWKKPSLSRLKITALVSELCAGCDNYRGDKRHYALPVLQLT
jgi:hypothetical protein